MILNNVLNTIRAGYGHFKANSRVWQTEGAVVKATDGTVNNGYFRTDYNSTYNAILYCVGINFESAPSSQLGYFNVHIGIGTSDASPTAEDSTLENMLLSASVSAQTFQTNEEGKLTVAAIVTNNTGSSKTYKEIGLIVNNQFQTGAASVVQKTVLLTRELLPEPITLGAGESATLTATFDWA